MPPSAQAESSSCSPDLSRAASNSHGYSCQLGAAASSSILAQDRLDESALPSSSSSSASNAATSAKMPKNACDGPQHEQPYQENLAAGVTIAKMSSSGGAKPRAPRASGVSSSLANGKVKGNQTEESGRGHIDSTHDGSNYWHKLHMNENPGRPVNEEALAASLEKLNRSPAKAGGNVRKVEIEEEDEDELDEAARELDGARGGRAQHKQDAPAGNAEVTAEASFRANVVDSNLVAVVSAYAAAAASASNVQQPHLQQKQHLYQGEGQSKQQQSSNNPNPQLHHQLQGMYNWQSTKMTVRERLTFMFNSEVLADVHFLVGRERSQQRIPAHRFVLSVGSAVFDAMFNSELATKDDEVSLPDVEPTAFLALLRFLYSDEVQIGPETVMTTLYTAKKYAVPALEKHCVDFLKSNLTPDNAFMLLTQVSTESFKKEREVFKKNRTSC